MAKSAVFAGNWKMFKTQGEAVSFIERLAPLMEQSQESTSLDSKTYLAVPFTAISAAAAAAKGTRIVIGAQNMHDADNGAYTGEISAPMLKDAGAHFVIIGHSERRHLFGESDSFINQKVKKALLSGLQPIFCVGESQQERQDGQLIAVLNKQIERGLAGISPESAATLCVAYEPIWAVGTGVAATPETAQEAHALCRSLIAAHMGEAAASQVHLLYGGSVTPGNASLFLKQPDIDGVLVGGASLEPDTFAKIIHCNAIAAGN